MKTIEIIELKEFLKLGKVKFIFDKKDGSKREAWGTLNEDLIPGEKKSMDEHLNPKASNPKYFDLEKNAWRSLSYDASTVDIDCIIF